MTKSTQFSFSGTLVHSNIIGLGNLRAFFVVWFTQKKFLTEKIPPISAVHVSFATFFYYLNFDLAQIPSGSFPIDVIYNGENRLWISFFFFDE